MVARMTTQEMEREIARLAAGVNALTETADSQDGIIEALSARVRHLEAEVLPREVQIP